MISNGIKRNYSMKTTHWKKRIILSKIFYDNASIFSKRLGVYHTLTKNSIKMKWIDWNFDKTLNYNCNYIQYRKPHLISFYCETNKKFYLYGVRL